MNVAHDSFSTRGSENGFVYPARGYTLVEIVHCATRGNKCFSRVAHDFYSTSGSESEFFCPVRGNKVHFMAR